MEYIIDNYTGDEETIEKRSARISGLIFKPNESNVNISVYTDSNLKSIRRAYKKTIKLLLSNHLEDGIYSGYKYTPEYINEVEKYLKSIK